ncbi:hypothetical protein JHK87_053075 [Glycine soja]|nr:hypothetical protein JHK87_053075 [Glycine soja]
MPSSDSGKPSDVPVFFASTIGSKPVGNNPRTTTSGTVNQATMPLMKAPNGNVVDTLSLCRAEITCMNEESSIVKKGYSAEGREKHVVLGADFQMAKDNLQQFQQPNMTVGDDGKQLALCEATRVLQASAFCEKDSYFKSPNLVTQPCDIDYGPLNMDLHSHTPPLLTSLSSQIPYHNKIKSPGTFKVYSKGTWCKKKKGLSNTCANLMEAGTEAWIQQKHEITPEKSKSTEGAALVPNSGTVNTGDRVAVMQKDEVYTKKEPGQSPLQNDYEHSYHSQGIILNEEEKVDHGQAGIGEEGKCVSRTHSPVLQKKGGPVFLKGPLEEQGGCGSDSLQGPIELHGGCDEENGYPDAISGLNVCHNQNRGGLSQSLGPLMSAEGGNKEYFGHTTHISKENSEKFSRVGMAATLASACSVPLTSVLLLFELTKDYRILLPLMGAVGLAIWVPSVTNRVKESETPDSSKSARGYSPISHAGYDNEDNWRQANDGNDLELRIVDGTNLEPIDKELLLDNPQVSQTMSKQYLKVLSSATLNDAIKCMHDSQQNCVLVVDKEDFLEGILTDGDVKRCLSQKSNDTSNGNSGIVDVCRKCLLFMYSRAMSVCKLF